MRNKFLKELKEIHAHQKLPQRVQRLEVEIKKLHGATPSLVRKYNTIDKVIVDSIKAAAKRTVKRKQFGYAKSPALTEAGAIGHFWKSVLTSKRGDIPLTEKAQK